MLEKVFRQKDENFPTNEADSFDDFYQSMEDLIKFFRPNWLFEISKVRLTGDTIIGYPDTSPLTSSFIFIMEAGDKLCLKI